MEQTQPTMLAIGAIVTDAFIKLRDDQAKVIVDEHGNEQLMIPFGLKLPYETAEVVSAVGNSANAAVAFSRLGLNGALMADVGDDIPGHDMLQYLMGQHVATDLVRVHPGQKSHYHYVLRYKADRTILIKYEDYEYGFYQPEIAPDWIYLSTISENSWSVHEELMNYLEAFPEVRFAFQPGTYHFEWGTEKLARLYARTEVIILNREEAAIITNNEAHSIKAMAESLYALGPKTIIITDGPKGSYAYDGQQVVQMPNYPDPAAPLDRTGAGDAFASTCIAAIAKGASLEQGLQWAGINSMNVVQKLGAQAGLLSLPEIEMYMQQAPEGYHTHLYADEA
jgi:ribokinase